MIRNILCKIGIHKWGKWSHQEGEMKKTPIGILYSSDVRGITFTQDTAVHERECERCGMKKRYVTDTLGNKI